MTDTQDITATEEEVRRACFSPDTTPSTGRLYKQDDVGNNLCVASIWEKHWFRQCCNKAKYEEHGHWFCGTHAPSKVKARKAKKNAKWQARRDHENALYDAKLRRERARDAVVEAAVAWEKSDTRFASLEMLETSEALCAAVRAYLEAKG